MKTYELILASTILALTLSPIPAFAGFDFCSGDGGEGGGSGSFQQQIPRQNIVEVGELPAGISGVEIRLTSANDIDIQLYDKATNTKLVHWPDGILSGSGYQTTTYDGVKIEWSGYNGDGTGLGNEYIRIQNANDPSTPIHRTFIMKVFGYRSGLADVNYSWTGGAVEDCAIPESGSGSFQQQIQQNAVVDVGDIPVGVNDLHIELSSQEDVDIQLYDKDTNTKLVHWPDGMLSGSGYQTTTYEGMEIEWSGYNGDGTGLGNEYIKISGTTTRNLTMKAFGYRSGFATVNYSWGDNENGGNDGGGSSEENAMKAELLTLVNQARSVSQNCGGTSYPPVPPLIWDSKLYQAALGHSEDMATNDFFDHTGSGGSNVVSRVETAGYSWSNLGENIAAGYSTAEEVMQGWLSSAGHCRNIMNSAFKQLGVAKATGGSFGVYWTQVFAAPQ